MSTAFPEIFPANPHIESLEHTMDVGQTKVDCLIIAHTDPKMIRRLTDAMDGQDVAVLPVCQADWESHLGRIVAWAVDAGINQVLIVGHSNGIDSIRPQVLAKRQQLHGSDSEQTTVNRLIAGARRNQQQLRDSKAHFADQLSRLRDHEELVDKECGDDFSLSALFYLANGGVFLRYSLSDGVFHP